MRFPFAIFLVLSISTTAHAASWETSSMRTPGGGLIQIGTSAEEVRREMGAPLHQNNLHSNGPKRGGREASWTYRGNDGYYTLQFNSGKVTRINVRADRD